MAGRKSNVTTFDISNLWLVFNVRRYVYALRKTRHLIGRLKFPEGISSEFRPTTGIFDRNINISVSQD